MSETLRNELAPTISEVLEELEEASTIIPDTELVAEEDTVDTNEYDIVKVLIGQGVIEGLTHTDNGIHMLYDNSTTEIQKIANSSIELRKDVTEQTTETRAVVEESYNQKVEAIERREAQMIAMIQQHFERKRQGASFERYARVEHLERKDSVQQRFFESKRAAVNIIADQIKRGENQQGKVEVQRSAAIDTYNNLATKKNELLLNRAITEDKKAQAEKDKFLIEQSKKKLIVKKSQVEFDVDVEQEALTLVEMEPIYVDQGVDLTPGENSILPENLPLGVQESTDNMKKTVNSDKLILLKDKLAEYETVLSDKLELIKYLNEEIAGFELQLTDIDKELESIDAKMSVVAAELDKLMAITGQLQNHSQRIRQTSLELTASQNDASENNGKQYPDFVQEVRTNQLAWSEIMDADAMDIIPEVPVEEQAKPIYDDEAFGALLGLELDEKDEISLGEMIEKAGEAAESLEEAAELLVATSSLRGFVTTIKRRGFKTRDQKLVVRKEINTPK